MKQFKVNHHVLGKPSSQIEGVFPELKFHSVTGMIDAIVSANNLEQFKIKVSEIAQHLEKHAGSENTPPLDAVVQTSGTLITTVKSLQEKLERDLTETEILETGIQIGFSVARHREGFESRLNAAKDMVIEGVQKFKMPANRVAADVIRGHDRAEEIIAGVKNGEHPLKAIAELLAKYVK